MIFQRFSVFSTHVTKLFLGALALLLLSTNMAHARPWYQIEVVVFAQDKGEYINSQSWLNMEQPDWSDALPLGKASRKYYGSSAKLNRLKKVVDRLEESDRYRVIMARSWRQAGARYVPPLRIESEKTYEAPNEFAVGSEQSNDSNATQTIRTPELEGTITVILKRFLHIKTDLVYHAPVNIYSSEDSETNVFTKRMQLAPSLTGEARLQAFRMKSSRKAKSGEYHYIDHPMFGMVVYIRPI